MPTKTGYSAALHSTSCLFLISLACLLASVPAFSSEKRAFVANCGECHGVSGAKIQSSTRDSSKKGPDLTGLKIRRGEDWTRNYMKQETRLQGTTHPQKFKGTDEELQTIIDWLGSLEFKR